MMRNWMTGAVIATAALTCTMVAAAAVTGRLTDLRKLAQG